MRMSQKSSRAKVSEVATLLVVNTMQSEPLGGELMVRGELVTQATRSQLREKLRAGELDELTFEAVVYRDGPNTNHVRFRPEDLSLFASSFQRVPFLRNHGTGDIGDRDGTVIESRLVGNEFHQVVRLSTERGVRDFLNGVMDRFSIGWYFDGVECSICHEDWIDCPHWPGEKFEGRVCELIFVAPRGKETSAVNVPAVQGTRILEQLCELKSHSSMSGIVKSHSSMSGIVERESSGMAENVILLPNGSVKVVEVVDGADRNGDFSSQSRRNDTFGNPGGDVGVLAEEVSALRVQMDAERVEQMIAASTLSEEGKAVVRLACHGKGVAFAAQMIEAQRKADGARVDAQLVRGIRPLVTEGMMQTGEDRIQSAWNWILGVQGEPAPVPSMRNVRDLYLAITGDYDWYGRFNPEWSQLASATTTTVAGITVNALNKVIKMHYDNMASYRWYEPIVDVAPHDGSTHNVQLITIDGIANLPIVSEGAAYTEATVGDAKEAMSFVKRGHYVGITLEAIRRSDIQRLQAIPRLLVQGAIRSRSAAIASLFTINTATGPTLVDDSVALFHATHANTATTAFDAPGVAWAAARTRIWEQAVPGTAKPLGLWPKFVLCPIELYDTMLTTFGYGSGDVGKPGATFGQLPNPYAESRIGDPRPVPIAVPDWTDATNWGYIVDPRLHPVIHMAYANAPQGGQHAMPEIFEVTDERSGLMFANDTMPVKIRDWWSYGVSTYVGIGNNIVA